MKFKENLAERLANDNELKQKLVENLGLSDDRTIRNYLNGTRQPNLDRLEIIVKTLNCTYDDLLN